MTQRTGTQRQSPTKQYQSMMQCQRRKSQSRQMRKEQRPTYSIRQMTQMKKAIEMNQTQSKILRQRLSQQLKQQNHRSMSHTQAKPRIQQIQKRN
jgi:hypothetical protein